MHEYALRLTNSLPVFLSLHHSQSFFLIQSHVPVSPCIVAVANCATLPASEPVLLLVPCPIPVLSSESSRHRPTLPAVSLVTTTRVHSRVDAMLLGLCPFRQFCRSTRP